MYVCIIYDILDFFKRERNISRIIVRYIYERSVLREDQKMRVELPWTMMMMMVVVI